MVLEVLFLQMVLPVHVHPSLQVVPKVQGIRVIRLHPEVHRHPVIRQGLVLLAVLSVPAGLGFLESVEKQL